MMLIAFIEETVRVPIRSLWWDTQPGPNGAVGFTVRTVGITDDGEPVTIDHPLHIA